MANNLLSTVELIQKANEVLAKHATELNKAAVQMDALNKSYAKLPSDYINALKSQDEAQKKVAKSANDIQKAQEQQKKQMDKMFADRQKQILKISNDEKRAQKLREAQVKKESDLRERLARQRKQEERQLKRSSGLYNRIQRGVTEVTRSYNDLATKKALNGKLTTQEELSLVKLEAKLQKYQGVLKQVDAQIGKHQRNVGNYKSGYDGLGNSVAQLGREMPAFANSVQTGFMAISNNLPIFFDEISRTRNEVARLRAEGVQTQGTMMKLAKAFFSFQSLLSVGVVLLTVYGKDIVSWGKGLLGASASADKLKENTKKINEESAKLSSQTIPQFKALVKISQDVTETEEKRADAIKELNKQFPDFNSNILKEGDNTDVVNTAISEYINKLGQKAKAQAAMSMAQEKYNELIIIEQKLQAARDKITEKDIALSKEKNGISTRQNATQRTATRRVAEYNSLLEKQGKTQKEINDILDVYIDNVDLSNKLNSAKGGGSATEKQVRDLKELKLALDGLKSLGINTTITTNLSDQLEKDAEKARDAKLAMLELSRATKAYLSSFSSDFIANSPLSSLGIFIDDTFNDLMEGAETSQEKFAVAFNAMADVAKQTFGFINQLGEANFEAQYERLAREKEVALQFAGGSTAAREEIERQYEEKRAAIQRKQAESQKRMAIFNSIVGTAQAVVTTFAQLGFPAGIPAAAIMAGLGLAQTALIASQPIPQFWQGGEVGGSQQIMVNDDPYGRKGSNYKEVIEKPNGQILTPQGKNVKMTVPKGSYVHPTYDAFINSLDSELLTNNIMPIGASKIMPMVINNGLTKGEVLEVMNGHAQTIVSSINNQHGININIDETGINKYIKKKGGLSKVMNARFSGVGKTV